MLSLPQINIDIVSDVVCPWCIIGYKKLEQAMAEFKGRAEFSVAWHAYELNPNMPAEGQDMREHIAQKYGASPDQSRSNQEAMSRAGKKLGFTFNFDKMRMVNTFDAHRLLHWTAEQAMTSEENKQTELKLALFEAHFSKGLNVSDHDVLAALVASIGLDEAQARKILSSDLYAQDVRATEAGWQDRFISGVPAFIFNGKFMVPGAQDSSVFAQIIETKLLKAA